MKKKGSSFTKARKGTEKKRIARTGNYSTLHHKLPQSRIQEFYGFVKDADFDGNRMYLALDVHMAWHKLFQNGTPAEVITAIKSVGRSELVTNMPGQKAWELLFGTMASDEDVIRIIEKDWMGPEVAAVLGYDLAKAFI